MKYLILIVPLLTGCLGTNIHDENIQVARFKAIAYSNNQSVNKPLVEIKCPPSGCIMSSFTVNNPGSNKPITIDAIPTTGENWVSLFNGFGISALDNVTKGFLGFVLKQAHKASMENAGDGDNIRNTSIINGDDNTLNPNNNYSSLDGMADNRTNDVDNSDNSTVDSHDQTATPTVVTTKPEVHVLRPEVVYPVEQGQ